MENASLPVNCPIARFVFSESQISRQNNRVKDGAFLPIFSKENNRWETSVFRVDGLAPQDVVDLGVREVESKRQTPPLRLLAWGENSSQDYADQKLTMRVDEPPHRHKVALGWPVEKDKQKIIAKQIARHSTLHLR